MGAPPVDDKPSDTLVVVSGEGFWTGSSTLPHLHQPHPGAAAASWAQSRSPFEELTRVRTTDPEPEPFELDFDPAELRQRVGIPELDRVHPEAVDR